MTTVAAGLVAQPGDAESGGADRDQTSSGLMLPVNASPRITTAAVPGISRPGWPADRGQHPRRGRPRRIVEHRERHHRDQPQRQHRGPARLRSQASTDSTRGWLTSPRAAAPAPAPAAGRSRAQRAGHDGDPDPEGRAEQQTRARVNGAREREDRDDDVGGEKRQGNHGPTGSPSRATGRRWAAAPIPRLRRTNPRRPVMMIRLRGTCARRSPPRNAHCARAQDPAITFTRLRAPVTPRRMRGELRRRPPVADDRVGAII